jgi:hypothetical protein
LGKFVKFEGDGAETAKQLQRSELLNWFGQVRRCLVGMEACATAH